MKEPIHPSELDPKERITGFKEVISGYREDQAVEEARRCLQCKNPLCIQGCPVGIDIKKFIAHIQRGKFLRAYEIIKEKNRFPSICGRVCPAEYQCRRACVLSGKHAPYASARAIQIHFLERFAGDYGLRHAGGRASSRLPRDGRRVAIVGSGPAGVCCAGELARAGVTPVLYEALHLPGGVLRYGIPEFRLPRDVLRQEIDTILSAGGEVIPNVLVGRTCALDELREQYDAVFLGVGAGTPSFLGIPGEQLGNVYSANEYLTRVNLMQAHHFPEYHTPIHVPARAVVIGGGNTAMDAARVALRLQAAQGMKPEVTVVYRRTEEEMPCRRLELLHAQEEGVKFKFLTQPVEFQGDAQGRVRGLRAVECRLGEKDASGRRRPVPQPDRPLQIECDGAVIAIGLRPNQVLTRLTPQLKLNSRGEIEVDSQTMATSLAGVFAGGDIAGGEGTVIEAMGMAKKAARGILHFLSGKNSS
ncbi:MAG: NADPH-dependent glutamate synthase [Candidatus Omnitrophica bacterium]|nr:NADPH-dependent glutamate synthase [Candidatus Omnitrophota bacterium]